MKRSVARCKNCGTEFVLEGEISGCPNCYHPELECFPQDFDENSLELFEDIPEEELVELAKDLDRMDHDDFMTDLMKENELTQKFLEELDRELDQIELPEAFNPTPAERTAMAKGKKDWSKEPHHSHCCCDKCAPTKEERDRRAADFKEQSKETPYEKGQRLIREGRSPLRDGSAFTAANGFEMDQCISCSNDCDGCEQEAALKEIMEEKERSWTNPKKIVIGRCRSCTFWNKLAPQAGSCKYLEGQGVNIKMWYDTCGKYRRCINYTAAQVEIRERRKAHESILKAMERNRS